MRGKRTSLRLGGKPSGKARLLERSPFEILLIASTRNVPLATLLASRFRLVTLEALCLARNASYGLSVAHVYLSVFLPTSPSFFPSPPPPQRVCDTLAFLKLIRIEGIRALIPLRLLDCLGLADAAIVAEDGGSCSTDAGLAVLLREVGSRMAEGGGILRASIPDCWMSMEHRFPENVRKHGQAWSVERERRKMKDSGDKVLTGEDLGRIANCNIPMAFRVDKGVVTQTADRCSAPRERSRRLSQD
jgi:hypothetical protein